MTCIVADSGPLIALGGLDLLHLPSVVFGQALVTQTVLDECLFRREHDDAQRVISAVEKQWLVLRPDPVIPESLAAQRLDAGELTALALALHEQATIMMDEAFGRRVAERMGLPLVGLCGLLLMSKRRALIAEVMPLLNQARANGYFLSNALLGEMRILANE